MKILALDLSLTSTGIALPDGTVQTLNPPRGKDRGMARLDWVARQIVPLLAGVDVVVIEGYSFSSRASHSHAAGELGGIVRMSIWSRKIPYADVPPSSLKKYSTGKGNAGKELVLVEAVKRLGYAGSSNDEADALWLRQMALDAYRRAEVEMPKINREGLQKVAWPQLAKLSAVA